MHKRRYAVVLIGVDDEMPKPPRRWLPRLRLGQRSSSQTWQAWIGILAMLVSALVLALHYGGF